jgi:DNA polymerase III delta prime subunit
MNIIELHDAEVWAAAWVPGERKLPHALLFTGQRGIGKFDLARAFAESLLCETAHRRWAGLRQLVWPAVGWHRVNHPDLRLLLPSALARRRRWLGVRTVAGEEAGKEETQSANHHRSGSGAWMTFCTWGLTAMARAWCCSTRLKR